MTDFAAGAALVVFVAALLRPASWPPPAEPETAVVSASPQPPDRARHRRGDEIDPESIETGLEDPPPSDSVSLGLRTKVTFQKLTDEQIALCLAVASDISSSTAERLREMRESNPQQFEVAARRLYGLVQLRRQDEELYRLKVTEMRTNAEVNVLARQWRAAFDATNLDEAAQIENRLRGLLHLQVALSIRARADYLCRLQDRVRELEKELETAQASIPQEVERRLQRLKDNPDDAPPRFHRHPRKRSRRGDG